MAFAAKEIKASGLFLISTAPKMQETFRRKEEKKVALDLLTPRNVTRFGSN